ncbi:MAG: carboxynorspermidine decarboxylase [Endomicrobiales bacterium]|jgi:carboxynorspermidine decarboxylase
MVLTTPYYVIDERRLLTNMKIIQRVREQSGARSVLALKCFATWRVFDLMKQYMDGTTSSSLFEARLGREKFGKEVHAYCVGFSKDDIADVVRYADKIIFNSVSQLSMFYRQVRHLKVGLRINPQMSYSHFDLADPARKYSRLGVINKKDIERSLSQISGVMFHCNCENDDFNSFSLMLDKIGRNYGSILKRVSWVSLGGGLYFTKQGYPVDRFCRKLKEFSETFNVQLYLEPGESAITQCGELVTKVVDIVHNKVDIAIVDASTEAHMLDLLIYRLPAKIENTVKGPHTYTIAGRSCLAGDIFGTYHFSAPLKVGSVIRFADAAGYTMVKKNWFNGLQMPSIVIKRLNGSLESVRHFDYKDFQNNLS